MNTTQGQGIIEMRLGEAYDDDLTESDNDDELVEGGFFSNKRNPFFANRPPSYFKPGKPQTGTMIAPGNIPVPAVYNNFAKADQTQTAFKKVQNDVLELASEIRKLKKERLEGGGMGDFTSLLLLGGLGGGSKPQIDTITFSDSDSNPDAFKGAEPTVSKVTYKEQKDDSITKLILVLAMMQGSNDISKFLPLLFLLKDGGL